VEARPSAAAQLFVIACGTAPVRPVRLALRGIDEVALRRGDAIDVDPPHRRPRRAVLGVPDPRMSSTHARFVNVDKQWHVEDRGSRNGTFVNGVRVEQAVLADGDVIDAGDTVLRYRDALAAGGEPVYSVDPATPRGLGSLVPEIQRELGELQKAAASLLTVLVEGETGTGKELVARAVHAASSRRGQFVAVNCGALPRERVAAELFGWRRGAFPGAVADHPGLVRASDGGTLFLDEIGDLPLADQVTLLRTLQEREVLPIAATQPIRVDLRVVAATHRPLDELAAGEQFRHDLLARLAGFRVQLRPLRERREDLGLLVGEMLRAHGAEGAPIRVAAWRALLAAPWPANVRELEHAFEITGTPPRASDAERDRLVTSMRRHGGNIAAVARELGKARMQVQRWLRRYEIDPDTFRRS
jgi:hypothetical protein